MNRLSLENVSRLYRKHVAVAQVSFDLALGEFLSLLGPSGCGKTTTLRMIAGFIEPSSGKIQLDGQTISAPGASMPPERRGMSMIFQSYAIWPHMTIFNNIAFGLRLRKLAKADVVRRVREILEIVKMDHLAEHYPGELSGGQQQRVALARAVVVRPCVLLLDEPLSNLDAALREEIRGEIRRLHNKFEMTTVYVTHDQAEAMAISDRIAVMDRGRIVQLAEPQTLYSEPATQFVASFIGKANLLPAVVRGSEALVEGLPLRVPVDPHEHPPGSRLTLSVRLHDVHLSDGRPDPTLNSAFFPARVQQRIYLGDAWHYTVRPDNGPDLLATAMPSVTVDLGSVIWIRVDITQAAIVGGT